MALALLGGSIACSFSAKAMALKSKFNESLNEDQRIAYQSVIEHRMALYLQGLCLGMVAGMVYLGLLDEQKRVATANTIGMFTLIVLGVQYMYYSLMPKPMWMLDIVTTPEQTKLWLEVYRHMSMRWHLGIAMGLLGSIVGCYGCLKR